MKHRFLLSALILALMGTRHTPVSASPAAEQRRHAAALLIQARRAVADKDLSNARRYAETAYRLFPAPKILVLLASSYYAEQGLSIEAADLARRYLASGSDAAEEESNRGAARRLLTLARAATAEIDVQGRSGAVVLLDGHPVGELPLSSSLLVRPGAHEVQIERGGQSSAPQRVNAAAGESITLAVELPQQVLILPAGSLRLDAAWDRFLARAAPDIESPRLSLVSRDSRDAILTIAPDLRGCDTLACRRDLAQRTDARYLLLLSAADRAPGQACDLSAQLFDVTQKAAMITQRANGPDCALVQAQLGLIFLAQGALRRREPPMGRLLLDSRAPAQRDVSILLDGRPVGGLPLDIMLRQGEHEVSLITRRGRPLYRERFEVGLRTERSVVEQRVRRPLRRVLFGSAIAALGVGLSAFGISALVTNGGCVMDPSTQGCGTVMVDGLGMRRQEYQTLGIGGGLLAGGVAAIGGGMLMALWPGHTYYQDEPAGAGSSPLSVSLLGGLP